MGVDMLALIRSHTSVLLMALILSMPRCVMIDHIYLNIKIYCCVFVWSSPPVNIVISGTDWCWHAGTDKELYLSFY